MALVLTPDRGDIVERSEHLARSLSLRHFIGIGINMCIGGSIFLVGSEVFRLSKEWSLIIAGGVGTFSLTMSLIVAEVSGRFSSTGGPYLYARVAFGPLCGFLVAWLMWFVRVLVQASLTNGVITSAGAYVAAKEVTGTSRVFGIALITVVIAVVNLRKIEQGARTILAFALLKLIPLFFVIGAGLAFDAVGPVVFGPAPATLDVIATAMLLLFTFSGYEVIPVTAGEGRNPRRDAPLATVISVLIMVATWLLLQWVLIRTVPQLGSSPRPVVASAEFLGGPFAGAFVNLGAIVSALGTCLGSLLSGSRCLYALGADALVPHWFGRVGVRTFVPQNAILFTAVAAFVLASTGSFLLLATAAAIPRLIIFFFTAACLLKFRNQDRRAGTITEHFRLPGGRFLAAICMLTCILVVLAASRGQLLFGLGGTAVGAILYALALHQRR